MRIIFGLGNPGLRYKNTRHNVGHMTVEAIAKRNKAPFRRSVRLNAWIAELEIENEEVILVKPRTFMNNSGICAKKVFDKYKCLLQEILVVHDDVDLPLGALKFREKGSSGGHRGIASILASLGAEEFNRLKIGIGRPHSEEVADYVLSGFLRKEKKVLSEILEKAVSACIDWVRCGSHYVMSNYNQRCQ